MACTSPSTLREGHRGHCISTLLLAPNALFSLRLARSNLLKKKSLSFACLLRVWPRKQGHPGSIMDLWAGPQTPQTSILGGPEPRFSSRFAIVLPFEFAFDFSMNFRSSLQLMPCRSWIGEASPNPDFVRPVEVFQGFFDIAHPCRHDESVVERSTIVQKSFEKID